MLAPGIGQAGVGGAGIEIIAGGLLTAHALAFLTGIFGGTEILIVARSGDVFVEAARYRRTRFRCADVVIVAGPIVRRVCTAIFPETRIHGAFEAVATLRVLVYYVVAVVVLAIAHFRSQV